MAHAMQNLTVSARNKKNMGYMVLWEDADWRWHIWFKEGAVNGNVLYKNPLQGVRVSTKRLKADNVTSATLIRRVMAQVEQNKLIEQADVVEEQRLAEEQEKGRQTAIENVICAHALGLNEALTALLAAVESQEHAPMVLHRAMLSPAFETALEKARGVLHAIAIKSNLAPFS